MPKTWPLKDGLVVRESDRASLREFANDTFAVSLDMGLFCDITSLIDSDNEKAVATRQREQERARLNLALMVGDTQVGAFLGRHSEQNIFRMGVSVIHPDFQGRGYYKELVEFVATWATEQGYRALDSVHNICNSRIIAAKLRSGFYIAGMESRLTAGQMVRLIRFLDPQHEELFKFRTGFSSPTTFVKDRLQGLTDIK